jgi:hypothetical protein
MIGAAAGFPIPRIAFQSEPLQGIILNLCTGKTIDIRDPRVVVVLKCDSLEYCPVNDLKKYMEFCKENGFVVITHSIMMKLCIRFPTYMLFY